ncbi:MAG TPA: P63C domain-containing protein [Syntrophobacter fumaroxidans]|nr:P63C domain-containing protein [Syntrophobacter fumaroxidans]
MVAEVKIPRATHEGTLKIGDIEFPCYVLDDGTRVLSGTGFMKGMGMYRSGALSTRRKASPDGAQIPLYLAYKNLKSFIPDDLLNDLSGALEFLPVRGRREIKGIKADVIPKLCEVWLNARDAGILKGTQLRIAQQADMLVRALAKVGIIALVDEATGYQETRERDELHRLLAAYLSEEKLKWAKMFPDEFYRQIYRLRAWPFPSGTMARTPLIGKLTNSLVYEKLPPGVIEELKKRNPVNPHSKTRKWKHHQFLSADLGQPDLRDHLLQLIAIMRASPNWSTFKRLFARAFPGPGGRQLEMEDQFRDGAIDI